MTAGVVGAALSSFLGSFLGASLAKEQVIRVMGVRVASMKSLVARSSMLMNKGNEIIGNEIILNQSLLPPSNSSM